MPTYHARSITVCLGSMPLAETTTSDVVLKKGEVAKRQSEAAERKLLRSGYLNEKRVLFPGDRDGFELNWLGNAPFMQVHADTGFTQSSGPYGSGHGPSEHNRPQALTLHVKLSDKAFLSGFNGKTHLKIEVLFNGQLSTCSLTHTNDIRSGAKSLHQVFAGYRVDFLAERPWVLLPPFATADGGTRRFRKTITPTERWEELSAAILKEAEERGTDKYGESPPSAVFLHALASMEMPECVKAMQKPGGRKFGVVDVVITAGYGNKLTSGTNYLKCPQRLRDFHYAVRTEINGNDEAIATEPDDSQDTTDKLVDKDIPDAVNTDAAATKSDAHHERPHKRRALPSVEGLLQYASDKTDFQSPFASTQIPFLPPPNRSMLQNNLYPTAGKVGSRCPSPEHRSDGHKEPLPANDRNCIHDTACGMAKAEEWRSDASRSYQEYHSPPSESEMHALHAGSVNPALASMPLFEHTNTHGPPFVGSSSASSPMSRAFRYHTSLLAQPKFPVHMDAPTSTTNLGPSTPFVAPTALMLPTPPNRSASPYYYPMHFQQQPQVGSYSYPPGLPPYMPPNGPFSVMPQTPPFNERSGSARFSTSIMSSPPFPQFCGPFPPTAMFAIPSKPRRSAPPGKGMTTKSVNASQSTVLFSRLVITGVNGMPVVDHVWKAPQRIIVNHQNERGAFIEGRAKETVSRSRESYIMSCTRKRNSSHNKTSQAISRTTSPTKTPHSKMAKRYVRERPRDNVQDGQVEQAISVPLPYLKRHQGPASDDMPINPKIDVPDKIAPFVSAPVLTATMPTLAPTPVYTPTSASPTQATASQRHTFLRSVLPGIQGPKAATFLFDDPEEVLREAARMRRSRSPTKRAATPPVPSVATPAHFKPTADREAQGDSSPLSSVPSSPLPERSAEAVGTVDAVPDLIPQLDGSPARKLAATSPRKLQTPSPTKPSFATRNFQRLGPAPLQSSVSPDSGKRKASHRSPTKPRNPDRLKTVDNLPLNDDCVIALAESVDKEEKRGILRQVKGERQGVFREEYVVLAVRFFITGN